MLPDEYVIFDEFRKEKKVVDVLLLVHLFLLRYPIFEKILLVHVRQLETDGKEAQRQLKSNGICRIVVGDAAYLEFVFLQVIVDTVTAGSCVRQRDGVAIDFVRFFFAIDGGCSANFQVNCATVVDH